MYVYMTHIRAYTSVDILQYMLNYTYIYCYAGSLMLNLMINMLSQNTDKAGKILLDQNVHRIAELKLNLLNFAAEVLVITQTYRNTGCQIKNNCCNWSNAMIVRV